MTEGFNGNKGIQDDNVENPASLTVGMTELGSTVQGIASQQKIEGAPGLPNTTGQESQNITIRQTQEKFVLGTGMPRVSAEMTVSVDDITIFTYGSDSKVNSTDTAKITDENRGEFRDIPDIGEQAKRKGVNIGTENRSSDVTIHDLREVESRDQLSLAPVDSDGKSIGIVHPLFPYFDGGGEIDDSIAANYEAYKEKLSEITKDNPLIPIIIFEHEPDLPNLSQTLETIGIDKGTVFLVATEIADPEPLQATLEELVIQLKQLGLNELVVNGSYFGHEDLINGGCAGDVYDTFQNLGVRTVVGQATF